MSGRHHVVNAVAAAAAALALGVDLDATASALSAARLRSTSRMEIHERSDGVVVIDDAYNANPDSTRAALDTLAEIGRARGRGRAGARTWAVLGDMLELGDSAEDEHLAIGRYVARLGIDQLLAVGDLGPALAAGAAAQGMGARAVSAPDKWAVSGLILPQLRPGDTVLVKASRGLALDTVAEEIWTAPPSDRPRPEPARHSEDPA